MDVGPTGLSCTVLLENNFCSFAVFAQNHALATALTKETAAVSEEVSNLNLDGTH